MSNTYTTTSGDMWDSIAFKVWGGESHTDKLIKANLQYRDIYIFPAGIVLKIPTIEPEASASLPQWKRGGGNG